MTVYAIAQLNFVDRAAYDRYQSGFLEYLPSSTALSWPPTSIPRSSRAKPT
jgi:hypothetical protein